MGIQDTQGKLQKITRLTIFRAAALGLKRLRGDEIILKIILYHLVCYVNVIKVGVRVNLSEILRVLKKG